ncbi:MAG: UDP-N-acetylmuramoyl-L-alanyl-D-glutamate--2,6-diaminopimelate ligase [Bacteroidales bacterium]|jgi:UDP-N-acetylmuramoyl-L-alanyl-D-glutamate--2,6-diaminopimelate ligase|nr:UDP-N-acetylmuramoyl-L-alanyl-D-glutamate--2,6-diaminopimelate ligase [Bacteroidales bacterium]
MKNIEQLLLNLKKYERFGEPNKLVSAIEFDSRKVTRCDQEGVALYVAQKGTLSDGHDFIEQAIAHGAGFIVCEKLPENLHPEVVYIKVADSSIALGRLVSAFYDYPSSKLKLVGITGTNGKTTTVTLLYRLFLNMGFKTGLLSTIENKINEEIIPATHTTPDAVAINKLLKQMVDADCEYAFMEVSSHAICQHRTEGLSFTGAVFSNITHDHLDFHKTFAEYIKAKKLFFDKLPKKSFALTNIDDKNGLVMVQNSKATVFTYSLINLADFKGKVLENSFEGMLMTINNRETWFKLAGKFNAYNLLAIFGTASLLGLSQEEVLVKMSELESAAGRFQCIKGSENRQAIVDYAHTPDALQNVLVTIRDIVQQNFEVITVVGCGGDRDHSKRPIMADMVCRYSNKVILTSDNPRSEDPSQILADMEKGVPQHLKKNVLVIENRKDAIKTATMLLPKNGILLIAGKGHENYQEIKGIKYPFDDRKIVSDFFENEETH